MWYEPRPVDSIPLPHWAMANAITSFATILAGVFTVALSLATGGQPRRWLHAYAWIFLTGIPTLGLHGFGEPFGAPSHPYWSVADTGSNLILAWAILVAVLGDFHPPATARRVALATLAINLAAIAWMTYERCVLPERTHVIPLGEFGGFYAGEFVLILDSFLVAGLLYRARDRIVPAARPVLHIVLVSFLVGLGLATAANEQVGGPVLAYHALWHLVGAFGFMAFWVMNHIRFADVR